MRLPTVVDFETKPIEPRPDYPPEPVSVAIWWDGKDPEFWAWGHPEGNNCSKERARQRLRTVWGSPRGILCHEAGFDLDVAETRLGLPLPPWHRIHDTTWLLWLGDPNSESLSLKPASEHYLDWPQSDQEPLRDWLLEQAENASQAAKGARRRLRDELPEWMLELRRSPARWEKWISKLPGHLAAKRAVGDVKRTRALFEAFYEPSEAYDRERRLLPVRLRMERRGIPVDVAGLEQDLEDGQATLDRIDRWLRKRLDDPNLEPWKRSSLVPALERAHLVDEWLLTEPSTRFPKGQEAIAYEDLREVCKDRAVVDTLKARSIVSTQVRTFVKPWLAQAQRTGGRVYVHFNQVRSASTRRGRMLGARTGRLSSDPNLMNVPEAQRILARSEAGYERAKRRAETLWVPVPGTALLDIRARVRSAWGWRFGSHDFSQQEMRLTAHFSGPGTPLYQAYRSDPHTDAHGFVRTVVIPRLGREVSHRNIKAVNFGIEYGEGLGLLAHKLDCSIDDAMAIKQACKQALGVVELDRTIKEQGYVTTLGGRYCPVEPESIVKGQVRSWEYKLLNTLIQGSAGDQLKEAMIQVDEAFPDVLLICVHDELDWEAPTREARALIQPIAKIMEGAVSLSVPMIAEGKIGRTWRDAK